MPLRGALEYSGAIYLLIASEMPASEGLSRLGECLDFASADVKRNSVTNCRRAHKLLPMSDSGWLSAQQLAHYLRVLVLGVESETGFHFAQFGV
jgi:hypothetical protein